MGFAALLFCWFVCYLFVCVCFFAATVYFDDRKVTFCLLVRKVLRVFIGQVSFILPSRLLKVFILVHYLVFKKSQQRQDLHAIVKDELIVFLYCKYVICFVVKTFVKKVVRAYIGKLSFIFPLRPLHILTLFHFAFFKSSSNFMWKMNLQFSEI